MMKTFSNARSIRNTVMVVAAVSAMALPLFASASSSEINVTFNKAELDSPEGQERLYERMKSASRKLCGSSNIQFTGAIDKSVGNDECYSGTLTAAVQRLDHEAITALHSE
jgi:UrcA family protein